MSEASSMDCRVGRRAPRRVLIDHRACGGGGCSGCKNKGTALVALMSPAYGPMPHDEAAFEEAREECPCYEGLSVNDGVAQCTHIDRNDGGEWCEPGKCPLVLPNHEITGPKGSGA